MPAELTGVRLDALVPTFANVVRPSPNYDRRSLTTTTLACVVLHATADQGDEQGAEEWLCDPRSAVSAHLLIRRDGTIVRLVVDAFRAWHAGASRWNDRRNVNDISLGWEIANRNDGEEAYTDAQYRTLALLGAHYVNQGIPLEAFVSHAEVAIPAGRKTDPVGFDWERFRAMVRQRLEKAVA